MIEGKYYYIVDTNIIPKVLLYNYEAYTITKIHSNYHIKKYYIIVNNWEDNIVLDIILSKCYHPNAYGGEDKGFVDIEKPPEYSKFCLPDTIKYKWAFCEDEEYIKQPNDNLLTEKDFENSFLKIWALDNPHHYPCKSLVSAEKQIWENGKMKKESFKHFI
jgi:hypothetical protein